MIYDCDGDVIAERSAYLGHATNNVAEYEGLILGLQLALDHGARDVAVYGDSELVVKQVDDQMMTRSERLMRLRNCALEDWLQRFDSWSIGHVYRESNTRADTLANAARDEGCRGIVNDWLPSNRS